MITFYPTISHDEVCSYTNTERALLTASSFASEEVRLHGRVRDRIQVPKFRIRPKLLAADCGGFVATFKWKGVYPYTPAQYVTWLRSWQPDWAATMDFCCEDEITQGKSGIVRERQQKTTEMAWHFWQTYQEESWAWVPTIQGWTVDDYRWHATEIKPLINKMRVAYTNNSEWRVGIGTLCRRASIQMIHDVVRAVSAILPGVPLHLWGIKLNTLQSTIALPESVTSMDSAAWHGLQFDGKDPEWKHSGMKRLHWIFDVALPRYEAKVAAALTSPKQLSLLDCEAPA